MYDRHPSACPRSHLMHDFSNEDQDWRVRHACITNTTQWRICSGGLLLLLSRHTRAAKPLLAWTTYDSNGRRAQQTRDRTMMILYEIAVSCCRINIKNGRHSSLTYPRACYRTSVPIPRVRVPTVCSTYGYLFFSTLRDTAALNSHQEGG